MPRRKHSKPFRRVQLRISDSLAGVFDSYSPAQLSELMDWALSHHIPGSPLGAKQVTIIRPKRRKTKTICRLSVVQTSIRLLFPEKLDTFRDVVKPFGFRWETPFWLKVVKEAQLCDRAAEITRALLDAGFCVQTEYEGITAAALDESFAPESLRLISARSGGAYNGWLTVSWPRGDDYYEEAKAITGAKYVDKAVIIPPEHYEEVLDFAQSYDFSVTPEAEAEIEAMRQAFVIGFIPSKKQRKQRAEKPVEAEGIPEDLRDED